MDITEQVEAENALRKNEKRQASMIANISDVISIVDENGINRFKSPNVEKWFGWKPAELIGKNSLDNIHPEDKERISSNFYSVLNSPHAMLNNECRYKCKDGNYKWIEATLVNKLDDFSIKGVLINYRDISDRKQAEEKEKKYSNDLKMLSSKLINTQENEKKLLAQELHDEIGQALTAMKINISAIKTNLPTNHDERAMKRIAESNEILDTIISQIHTISLNLRPELLDVLGLAATLKSYSNQFARRTGIRVHFTNKTQQKLDSQKEINLYRIVQEAFTNTAKHAEAQNIFLSLQENERTFFITMEDDGKGFNSNKDASLPGIGLIGMKERVNSMKGTMKIESNPGKGTSIKVEVPLNDE